MPFQKGNKINLGRHHSKRTREKIREKNLGKKLSEITKEKIRQFNLDKELSKEHKIKIGLANAVSLKGKKLSETTRKKMREAKKGDKCYLWKGGITSENEKIRHSIEFRLWREKVFKRDNWTCQKYKTEGGKLHPHHIKNFAEFPELRFVAGNGITLSEKAHKEFHKIYGKKNNNEKQLMEFNECDYDY